MSGFRLPGVVWSGLLVALPLLAAWLEQYFPGAIWAAPLAGLLLIVAKVVEVGRAGSGEQGTGNAPAGTVAAAGPEAGPAPNLWWG
jgi:hypothetical protein